MNTLNSMTYQQVKSATEMAVGRSISNSDRMEMSCFGDCYRNDFWWDDGACSYWLFDTKEEAIHQAETAGFSC